LLGPDGVLKPEYASTSNAEASAREE
jgi:hypothetical protein